MAARRRRRTTSSPATLTSSRPLVGVLLELVMLFAVRLIHNAFECTEVVVGHWSHLALAEHVDLPEDSEHGTCTDLLGVRAL